MLSILFDNPILTREMRRRMRGKAMIYSLITYVAALVIVTFFILLARAPSLVNIASNSEEMITSLQGIGHSVFAGMVVILVPRLRTRPLTVRYQSKDATGATTG